MALYMPCAPQHNSILTCDDGVAKIQTTIIS